MNNVNLEKLQKLDFRLNEAYKILRTNIEFCGDDIKTIVITSCMANECKSNVSLNLARSMAEAGKKVVFVDADLRNKNDHYEVLENENLIGFFCVIREGASIEIGLGMRPDLCGKGKGRQFLEQILAFIERNYEFDKLIMNVASFNQRAIKVYHSCGFLDSELIKRSSNGGIYEFLTLIKKA